MKYLLFYPFRILWALFVTVVCVFVSIPLWIWHVNPKDIPNENNMFLKEFWVYEEVIYSKYGDGSIKYWDSIWHWCFKIN